MKRLLAIGILVAGATSAAGARQLRQRDQPALPPDAAADRWAADAAAALAK